MTISYELLFMSKILPTLGIQCAKGQGPRTAASPRHSNSAIPPSTASRASLGCCFPRSTAIIISKRMPKRRSETIAIHRKDQSGYVKLVPTACLDSLDRGKCTASMKIQGSGSIHALMRSLFACTNMPHSSRSNGNAAASFSSIDVRNGFGQLIGWPFTGMTFA